MPVAVKNSPEAVASHRSLFDRLAVSSLAGMVYVLGSLGIIFYAIPALWEVTVFPVLAQYSFVAGAALLVAMLAAAAGLVYLGARLAGPNPPHGLKAGIFLGVVGVVVIGLLTLAVGNLIQHSNSSLKSPSVGVLVTCGLGIVLLVLGIRGFLTPTAERWMVQIEDQGWFSTAAYKRSQGLRVRRGTMLGVIVLAACGIYTLLSHKTLEAGPTNWAPGIPFTDYAITSWKIVGPFPRVEDKQYPPEQELPQSPEEWEKTPYGAWHDVQGDPENHGVVNLARALNVDRQDVVGYAYAEISSGWERSAELQLGSDDSLVVWLNGKKIHEYRRDREWKPGEDALKIRLEKGQNRLLIKSGRHAGEWRLSAELSPGKSFMVLPHVRFTVPLILAALALWLAFRAVNFAPFADFLIATEAELNKVSWTTRRRLVQDTIVVLTCVILLTLFLFVIDVLWGWILSSDYIGVLMVDQDVKEYFQKYDANHDGYIDPDEAPGVNFEQWDRNHDGKLDKKEVKQMLHELNSMDETKTTPY